MHIWEQGSAVVVVVGGIVVPPTSHGKTSDELYAAVNVGSIQPHVSVAHPMSEMSVHGLMYSSRSKITHPSSYWHSHTHSPPHGGDVVVDVVVVVVPVSHGVTPTSPAFVPSYGGSLHTHPVQLVCVNFHPSPDQQ